MLTLRIASNTCVKDCAGAIAGQLRESNGVFLQAIGAAAVNQATKAIALADVFLKDDGWLVLARIEKCAVDVQGEKKTGVRWRVIAVQTGKTTP